jgi:putative hydrolase of the HAD superfamily
MAPVEAVILDLGNVLAFHDDDVLFGRLSAFGGATPAVIRQRMLELWDSINRGDLAGDDLRRTICQVAGASAPMDPETFFEVWSCHFRVHQEVLPLVESLLGRVKVMLLSNTNEAHWRSVRPQLPIVERFHHLVLSYELRLAKPDPEIFREAIRCAGTAPGAAVFFDDVQRFVDAAIAAGMQGRVFTNASNFRAQLAELGIAV